ncbi:MAG: helix-turn-helix transcriptional regulator [Rhodobacterales bacterium]|nr:helix-turn-helix transcriptional regulator [Rhodobacterales bacterium]
MTAPDLTRHTVFNTLQSERVPLIMSAGLGDTLSTARWLRDERTTTRYTAPSHHTLSLYVRGGTGIRRFRRAGHHTDLTGGAGPGSLCLMPAGVTTDWDIEGPVELFHLYLPVPLFHRLAAQDFGWDPASAGLADLTFFRDDRLESLIRHHILPRDPADPVDRMAATEACQAAVHHVMATYGGRPARRAARGGLAPAALARVRQAIDDQPDADWTLAGLAAVAGLSEYHFARMFRASMGESPHAYLLRRRVLRARDLLARPGGTLADVALACGFASQSHLTERFRQLMGVTPARYRRIVAG